MRRASCRVFHSLTLCDVDQMTAQARSTVVGPMRFSVALYHLCTISTRAAVVDVPLISSNHCITIFSNSFAAIAASDIGRMSLCIEAGGLTLGKAHDLS